MYRSSAGSGKTRTLAREYLLLALRFRADYFKHILAVTFANKATQEMKDRILSYLNDFATGRPNELTDELRETLKLDDSTFRQYAQEAQAAILHQYDRFSISTIDAFFQKVIRSFTRESGLVGDYRLEVEQDVVLEEVIDNLIDELGSNEELTQWVVEFAKENLENERAWDVRSSLLEFATEIFREEFKDIESVVMKVTADRKYFTDLRSTLIRERSLFFDEAGPIALEAIQIIKNEGWAPSDFYHGKNSGLSTFFEGFTGKKNLKSVEAPKPRIRNDFTIAGNWPSKTNNNRKHMIDVAEKKLVPIVKNLIEAYETKYKHSLTAEVILQNLYVFGLVSDISRKLAEYKDEHNLMLLADAPKFLNGVIQDSDTPFIYEKVGSFYRNFLIDEFQDTSAMQWKNFLPLLNNSLDQGYSSMVVGDVKQAIYRWRGGDLKLLQEEIETNIGESRVAITELATNFRSAVTVVSFNNLVFENASQIISRETNHQISIEAYRDVRQKNSRKDDGFVQVKFIREIEESKWKVQAMESIPSILEDLQSKGASLSDIAILVRRNDEGQQIVAHLLQYKNSEKARHDCLYDVVSNESLRIDGASSVNLLLAAMRYLLNAEDAIARAQLAYEFNKIVDPDRPLIEVFAVTNNAFFESNLPPSFIKEKVWLKKLPLVELTETLISIFKLGEHKGEISYLLAFQNLVLEFYARERNDLGAFLEWWEDNKHKKSVQLSGELNAVQILTIHKSKGLQFKYVIIPFCAWSLDHDPWKSPTLWAITDETPFDSAGFVPIKYSSTLENTYFSDYYSTERTRSYLDNLNLLYVALTRPENGLIILAPHPDVKNTKKTVATLLYNAMQHGYTAPSWNQSGDEFNIGDREALPRVIRKEVTNDIQLFPYPSYAWRDKLVIRHEGKTFFDETSDDRQQKAGYGIYIHTILSRIKYAEEIPDAMEHLVLEGLLANNEKTELLKQLDELMTNAQVASWFASYWEVRTEVPVLVPGGRDNRIDRLITKAKKAIVIDFKTGLPTKNDQKQVQEYVDLLRKMNFIEVDGFLLYIRTKEVVSVSQGKVKAKKLKDEKQLGLGF
ncbi:MAG: UvrD-helicase domain-containing protein [Chryseolinea sp.]